MISVFTTSVVVNLGTLDRDHKPRVILLDHMNICLQGLYLRRDAETTSDNLNAHLIIRQWMRPQHVVTSIWVISFILIGTVLI